MAEKIDTRSIAEHLCTLASLLEAEAMRLHALGIKPGRDLSRQASEVRRMADMLWAANMSVILGSPPGEGFEPPRQAESVVPVARQG